jgi:hypothetical protein
MFSLEAGHDTETSNEEEQTDDGYIISDEI